ncbi:MAG TPA: hypothetical protein VFS66_08830 [Acidimicrobiia bacterium]|nr:hypothetical protein [Acidimicrobiia bacterium]
MPYRYIYVGLALIGLAAIAFGVALSPEGEAIELPEQIEAISPLPGDLVPPQATLEIDLVVGYVADITVDGWPIVDARFVEATGVYTWAPSPTSPTITEWTPGEHTVNIVWNTYTGLPDTGRFKWTFRVG